MTALQSKQGLVILVSEENPPIMAPVKPKPLLHNFKTKQGVAT